MKKTFLTVMLSLCMTAASAYDYAYVVLQKTDGSTVAVSTSGMTLSASGSDATLTVNGTAYTVSDLAYMFFTNTAVNEVTIPSVGWATFCAADAADYSSVSGLTAYTATFTSTDVTLHELSGSVVGGTGVVLKGEAGTYSIPVVAASGAVTPADNDLTGTLESVSAPASSYALAELDNGAVGFKLLTTGISFPAQKAYYTAASAAREYFVFSENGTTAIEGVAVETDSDGLIYDLQGRIVTSPRKGMYIKNGKKIIIK